MESKNLILVVSLALVAMSLGGCITNDYAEGPGCTNTCRYAMDNDCDDGGEGSDYSLCELGTDCADCGSRNLAGGGYEPEPEGEGGGGGGGGGSTSEQYACSYTRNSRFTCAGTGTSGTRSTNPGCRTITADTRAEADSECRSSTRSDTDCSGSCCSRSYYTDVRVELGSCR